MEPIFSSECNYTKEVLEFVERKMMQLWIKIVFICATVFMLRTSFVGIIEKQYGYTLLFLLLGVSLAVYFFYLPRIRANVLYKQTEKLYNGSATIEVLFYENEFTAHNLTTNANISFSYNDVTKIHEKNGIYILVAKGVAVLVDSSTIKTQSDISFPEFLQRKTLNVK